MSENFRGGGDFLTHTVGLYSDNDYIHIQISAIIQEYAKTPFARHQ